MTPPSTSRPFQSSSASSPRHASRHGRSKSGTTPNKPKLLPFPDLPELRSSRDSSRATSPLPTPSREITFDQMIMARGGSSDGGQGRQRSSGSGGRNTPTATTATSPSVSSPLAAASLSRARALTAPTSANGSPDARSAPSPRRMSDFQTDAGPSRPSTSASSAPSVAIAPPIAPPILLAPSSSVSAPATQPRTPVKISHTHERAHHVHTQSAPPAAATSSNPTTAVIPTPSLQPISEHLYKAFLNGVCADVRLIVRKWGVAYDVHKMIMSQSSFFTSLFLGGFSEATLTPKPALKGKGKARIDVPADDWLGESVELQFDDPNITRAAFEICLARLYCPYPTLNFPTSILPTSTHPLTPSFPSSHEPAYASLNSSQPQNTHLATPRLLLSLLATTVYLGHGALLREVLCMILRTVSPVTVRQYLAFATGDGIGEEEWEGQSEEGAKGFEKVAKPLFASQRAHPSGMSPTVEEDPMETPSKSTSRPRLSSDSDTKVGHTDPSIYLNGTSYYSSSFQGDETIRSQDQASFASADAHALPQYYGVVGDKIGEACNVWLARWGADILHAEMETPNAAYRIWGHDGLPARFVRALLSSDFFFVKDEMERYQMTRNVLDLRRKGWEEMMEGVGDVSFSGTDVEHEWEEWEDEEREIQRVFAEGIRYCHMTFEDLSTIASDLDPHTSLPYAPLAVLQAAHWAAADLRARVTAHERIEEGQEAEEKDELGLTHTTSEIVDTLRNRRRRPTPRSRVPSPVTTWGASSSTSSAFVAPPSSASSTTDMNHSNHLAQSVWYPVPSDETHRIGASGLLSSGISGVSGVPDFGPDLADVFSQTSPVKSKPAPHGEKSSFGLVGGKATASEIEDKWVDEGGGFALLNLGLGKEKQDQWTKTEPFRFSVEFWDVDKLGEKERYYSATHFYAGSLFNCYIQMIKRKEKGVQLGIYLHRQSPNEPFPAPSAPHPADGLSLTRTTTTRSTTGGPMTPAAPQASLMPSPVIPGSPPATNNLLSLRMGQQGKGSRMASNVPYHDTRKTTKAYFSISCASALGTALIRFTSGPDSFAHSQSWGWKSSALKSEEYLSVPPVVDGKDDLGEGVLGWSGEVDTSGVESGRGRCTLRATVVVGVV
ncbi:hypothetical protein L202_00435 [Cryptococcus amylolentus CBS 6039]|uniref:BTB domain-containing protein n=1 Tax=Cryptococcus amylolentus CBS 6039 TaxID=1295533 RepID=A0A1E3I7F1_9TREE|nr:hypothetical protein L202_00435 [Cryptococcus amylolentus CBS 6039]ODN84502.1 hypothetical protein L202_00435 [Cryptococcus amylolentus CBS 6039]